MTAVPTVACQIADLPRSEFERCKQDIVYFAERYVKIVNNNEGVINPKLRAYQKRYLRSLVDHKLFACSKCRQCGIITMNMIFAYWKANFFENQKIVMTACRYYLAEYLRDYINTMCTCSDTGEIFDNTMKYDSKSASFCFKNRSRIFIAVPTKEGSLLCSPHDAADWTLIIDDMAYMHCQESIRDMIVHWKDCNVIVSSTPFRENDPFGLLYSTLPTDMKMKITWKDFMSNAEADKLRIYIGENVFKIEYC